MRTIDTSVEQPTVTYIPELGQNRETRRQTLEEYYYFKCECKRCRDHEDKDLDLNRYQYVANYEYDYHGDFVFFRYLIANEREDVSYWDEVLRFERQIVGPHFPDISNGLFQKFKAFSERYGENISDSLISKWLQIADEVENEFLITHGKEHPDYWMIEENLRQMRMIKEVDNMCPVS